MGFDNNSYLSRAYRKIHNGTPITGGINDYKDPVTNYQIYVGEIDNLINSMNNSINYGKENSNDYFTKSSTYYNRFKLPSPNEAFTKGFAHVFITRPNCNIDSTVIKKVGFYKNANDRNEELIKQLKSGTSGNQFMYSLSNKVISFSPNDEYIGTESYGKTWGGHKITIGRTNIESKSANEVNITFKDDRDLDVYTIIKLWCEYINGVYIGLFSPLRQMITLKTLDYASSIYYFITAEDGETVVFWSKYYGTFPSTVPTTQYAWAQGNVIDSTTVNLDVKFNYSFKEDCNPETMNEFNNCITAKSSRGYADIYDSDNYCLASTWKKHPYIIRQNNRYKLKFFD